MRLIERSRLPRVWWNFTRTAGDYREADAIVVSIPKSGRTWLRVFLAAYFCGLANRPFTMKTSDFGEGIPKVDFTHDIWEAITARRLKNWLLGKFVIPRRERISKPIILLARDPRDIIVSLFFDWTKRITMYRGGLSELVRHPKFGVETVVDIMNIWIREWSSKQHFKLVHYEDLRRNPQEGFSDLLRFLGLHEINESILSRSLQFSTFENMKAMEAGRKFVSRRLVPGDVKDPESFKVRRGKIGGYRDYLGSEDVDYLNRALLRLDERYGYRLDGQNSSEHHKI